MEVLVTFLQGDPDQPPVTGCLYHKGHQVSYDLNKRKEYVNDWQVTTCQLFLSHRPTLI